MLKKTLIRFTLISMVVSLAACSSNTRNENTGIGAVTGAVVGGLAGSLVGGGTGRAVAIGAGAVVGALAGGYIGRSMDSTDDMKMYKTLKYNPTNKARHWKNKRTGVRYTMVPMSGRMTVNGNPNCRKYRTTAVMHGKKKTVYGVACMQSNGTWQAVN